MNDQNLLCSSHLLASKFSESTLVSILNFNLGKILSLVGVGIMMLSIPSWGDCQASYSQAVGLLDNTTKQASHNEHPSPDAFSNEFKSIVTSLQAQKCMPELMSLIQHIQSEQQKIPNTTDSAGKDTGIPITD